MDDQAAADTYIFKPSLFGAPAQFQLTPEGLAWGLGGRSGVIPYATIGPVRISFRPSGLIARAYQTEIWSPSAPKLTVSSQSTKNMVEKIDQGAPYRAFVESLHRRIGEAGARPEMVSGITPYLYWPGVVVFAGLVVAFVALIARSAQTGAWAGVLFVAAFLAMFTWQIGSYFWHNRPGTYTADALPQELLPRS